MVYATQPDALAAVTVIPAFCWLGAGLILSLAGFRRSRRKASVLVLMLWGAFAAIEVPETISLARGWITGAELDAPDDSTLRLRVITFNAGRNGPEALREVAGFEPDVVLLQEIRALGDVERLGHDLFGDACIIEIHENDTAVVARGKLSHRTEFAAESSGRRVNAVRVTVEMDSGRRVELVSVHLSPAVVRLDYWNPDCWRMQTRIRKRHREELRQIVQELPESIPVIVGGDFNSPARDGCTSVLGPALADAFEIRGVGWGNTGPNAYPLHRMDQIWVSPGWDVLGAAAVASQHSDHRLLICDLEWPRRP